MQRLSFARYCRLAELFRSHDSALMLAAFYRHDGQVSAQALATAAEVRREISTIRGTVRT